MLYNACSKYARGNDDAIEREYWIPRVVQGKTLNCSDRCS